MIVYQIIFISFVVPELNTEIEQTAEMQTIEHPSDALWISIQGVLHPHFHSNSPLPHPPPHQKPLKTPCKNQKSRTP